MDMLERAARAALDEFGVHLEELAPGAEDDIAQRVVRAVLLAIREPSFDMMNAGRDAVLRTHRGGVSGMTIEAQTRNECIREIAAWQAMIDEILRDQ